MYFYLIKLIYELQQMDYSEHAELQLEYISV